jgi:glycosyltransferase involved in cell wall biosynthesis
MFKIGFDAKRAFQNFTGLGNYSRSVLDSLALSFPGDEFYMYAPKLVDVPRTAGLLNQPNLFVKTPETTILKSLWRSRLVVKDLVKDGIQLYHGLSNEIPVRIQQSGVKSVVTIHDLIFLRYPQYYKPIDRKIYEVKFKNACKNADKIIAISEQTKRDIVHFFGTEASKIEVIYQSCTPEFEIACEPGKLQQVREKYALPEKFLLNVGTIEIRKNALLIVKALAKLEKDIHLVIIGKETPYANTVKDFIQKHQLTDRVHFLQDVSFEDLPAVYQLSTIFVYPSEFEGFGIPILEALKSNVPVIAATGSCLEEAGGPDSIYVNPNNEDALAAAISKIWNDAALQSAMKIAGKKFASDFTEMNHAKNLMQLYTSLLKS